MATTMPVLPPKLIVTVEVNSKGEVQSGSPDRFEISKNKHEEEIWQASDPKAYFTVDFGHESPFAHTHFCSDHPCSGLVRREVLGDRGKPYKYTVRAGGASIDPDGVVDR